MNRADDCGGNQMASLRYGYTLIWSRKMRTLNLPTNSCMQLIHEFHQQNISVTNSK
jgi:hypothetical protein